MGMFLQLVDQPLNRFSAPDLYASPQRTQMAAAAKSWIASLEFGLDVHSKSKVPN